MRTLTSPECGRNLIVDRPLDSLNCTQRDDRVQFINLISLLYIHHALHAREHEGLHVGVPGLHRSRRTIEAWNQQLDIE